MILYTMGFTQKSAEQFFGSIKEHGIDLLVDIRLNNKSQMAGFTKGDDLRYFLDKICSCEYRHCVEYAPTKDVLDGYKKKSITWDEYVEQYISLMRRRQSVKNFIEQFSEYGTACLLCSEPAAEMIAEDMPRILVRHI